MPKLAIAGLVAVLLSCGSFFGYHWYVNRPAEPEAPANSASFEEIKTDFISIAVFKEGKVDGYITFRANIGLLNAAKIAEAGYVISDAIHRKLPEFSELFSNGFKSKDAALIEEPLLAALSDRLGKENVNSIKLTDLAYDKRVE